MTPLRLLRIITPFIGTTNSIAQFVRVIITILKDCFSKVTMLFVDDIRVKGLYTNYDNKLALFRIRYYVFEYIQNLDIILNRIEKA